MKRLFDNNEVVTIHWGNQTLTMTRRQAVNEIYEKLQACKDSRRDRYENIFLDLICGKTECYDK